MKKEKIKVYLYTRVSTTMQIDGYSLDAQKTKMKAFCDYNEYEIAGEYEDAGKSGKSIEGRVSFNQMMEDRQVKKDGYLLVDGRHEALVSEEVWEQAQVKVAAQAKKYEKVNRDKREKIHLLSGILKCPVCGAGMYGNKSIKKRKDGSNYKDFYYYGCKHRNMTRGHKCDYKKQVHEEMLDASVAEVISKLVSNPKFSDLIRNKINMEVDTGALD